MSESLTKCAWRRYSTGCWDKLPFNLSVWVPTVLWKLNQAISTHSTGTDCLRLEFQGFKRRLWCQLVHGRKKSKWSCKDVPVLIWFPTQQPNPGMKIKLQTQISPLVTTNKKMPSPTSPPKKEAFRILPNPTGECNQLLRRRAVNNCLCRPRQHGGNIQPQWQSVCVDIGKTKGNWALDWNVKL